MEADPSSRWPELDAVFETALELEAEERAAFLARRCAADPDLHAEVEALVAAADSSADFLEDRGVLIRTLKEAHATGAVPDPAEGHPIGVYRVVGEIGRGGMGVVYRAERADGQFEQAVALKVLGGWAQAVGELGRFQRERQILARLQHPNIARLLDGGVTDDGRPYFVMEHVEGKAIDRYCDEARLGVRARLELFLDVCAAVEVAHRNLVVHRDIKPGNVLVTEDGTPKLLDFGIAKLLGEGETPAAVTRSGLHPMTPEYASPEMLRGDAITTASDVYQLGVLLYHLLSGSPPYRLTARSPAEIERTVTTVHPERPSQVVLRPSPGRPPDDVARARGSTPEGLRRRLRGDLDTIVLKALRKEPERRYGSVEELAGDLRRHLQGHPVRARRDTFAYRSGKFVRRHWFGVGTAIVAVTLLAGFALAMARQAERTARERNRAEQVTAFLVDLFRSSDPGVSLGDTLTVRQALDEGAIRIRTELEDQPEVRARLMEVMGTVYGNLGLYAEARGMREEALAIRRRVLPPGHVDIARSAAALGLLLFEQRDLAGAESLLEEARQILTARRGPGDLETAGVMNDLALVWHGQGRVAEAEPLYRAALDVYRTAPGPPDPDLPATLSNLGWILMGRGDYASADSVFRESLAIRRQIHPAGHPRIANSLSALASLLNLQERYAEAEPLALEALMLRRTLFGESHPLIAESLLALAGSVAGQSRRAEAETLYRESLDMFIATLGEDTPDAARALSDLAGVLADLGLHDEAEAMARRALATYEQRYGSGGVSAASARANLAYVLLNRGDHDRAAELYRDAVVVLRNVSSRGTPRLARVLTDLGRLEMERGNAAAGERCLREALDIRERLLPAAVLHTSRLRLLLGECLLAQGGETAEEAETLIAEAYATLRRLRGGEDQDVLRAEAALIRLGRGGGDPR